MVVYLHDEPMQDQMVELLAGLVGIESPSSDPALVAKCGDAVGGAAERMLGCGPPERVVVDGTTHFRWRFGAASRVVLIGHLDTVWPAGTLNRWPFAVDGNRASGPGAFDMKAGIVQALFALAGLASRDGVTLLLTADEELGSPTSRQLIEDTVAGAGAALILEPSAGAGGAVKTARKGVSNYELVAHGRAAHAGLEPEKGLNATVEIAHQVLALESIARPAVGTTVTPTVMQSGTATNVVPAEARVKVDVRATSIAEQSRVDTAIRERAAVLPGVRLEVLGGPNRPPLEARASAALFAQAQRCATALGLPALEGVEVGGGSDGNFTAAMGVPTLDGLGPVGDGAHAEGEYVLVDAMPQRAALLAALIRDLLSHP
jgi:glutamate carboxypeptidase